ncbi:MAG: sensor histidine kinase, partial [Natronosporangium sp.]
PVAALTVVVAAVAGAELLGILFTPFASNASASVGLVMYTVAVQLDRRFSLTALAVVAAVTFAATGIATYAHPQEDWNAVQAVAAGLGWLVGDTVRTRRHYQADLATRRRREADERTRRAIAEERLRISREVHDVISHNLSVIAVRSGVGRMLFDSQPEEARTALLEVENVSRSAIAELRRLLDSVRDRDSLAPAPRLRDLPDLVERVKTASDVEVSFDQRGMPAEFHPTFELSAYRIVQEALTNVLAHAGRTRAQVVVDCRDDALWIAVTNEPGADRPPAQTGEGWGLVGMRERAALFGGTVEAGPRSDGGFRVSVRLPITAPAGVPDDSRDRSVR